MLRLLSSTSTTPRRLRNKLHNGHVCCYTLMLLMCTVLDLALCRGIALYAVR